MVIDLLRSEDNMSKVMKKLFLKKDSGFHIKYHFVPHSPLDSITVWKKGILTIQWLPLINPFYLGQAEPIGQENQINYYLMDLIILSYEQETCYSLYNGITNVNEAEN